jgi:hypothetical protein
VGQEKVNQSRVSASAVSVVRATAVIEVVPAGRAGTLKAICRYAEVERVPSRPGVAITGPVEVPAWNSRVTAWAVGWADAYRKVTVVGVRPPT